MSSFTVAAVMTADPLGTRALALRRISLRSFRAAERGNDAAHEQRPRREALELSMALSVVIQFSGVTTR